MSAYWYVAYDVAGYLLGVGLAAAMLVGIIWYQYQEYRQWTHSLLSYWLLKVATPVMFLVLALLVVSIASDISGMESLAVFYLGLAVLVALVPLLAAFAARLFGLSFRESLTSAGSLFIVLLGLSFSFSMLANSGGALLKMDFTYQLEKYKRRAGKENPGAINDRISLGPERWYTLPDGQLMLVLEIENHTRFDLDKVEIRIGESDNRYRGARNFCERDNRLIVSVVIRNSSPINMRLLLRGADPAEYFGEEYNFEVPAHQPDFIQLFHHQGRFDLTAPISSERVQLITNGSSKPFSELLPIAPPNERRFMKQRCTPPEFIYATFDALQFSVYSADDKKHVSFQLLPRNVYPDFR